MRTVSHSLQDPCLSQAVGLAYQFTGHHAHLFLGRLTIMSAVAITLMLADPVLLDLVLLPVAPGSAATMSFWEGISSARASSSAASTSDWSWA